MIGGRQKGAVQVVSTSDSSQAVALLKAHVNTQGFESYAINEWSGVSVLSAAVSIEHSSGSFYQDSSLEQVSKQVTDWRSTRLPA